MSVRARWIMIIAALVTFCVLAALDVLQDPLGIPADMHELISLALVLSLGFLLFVVLIHLLWGPLGGRG